MLLKVQLSAAVFKSTHRLVLGEPRSHWLDNLWFTLISRKVRRQLLSKTNPLLYQQDEHTYEHPCFCTTLDSSNITVYLKELLLEVDSKLTDFKEVAVVSAFCSKSGV